MRFEAMVGLRYLRAKRKQAVVSVITVISIVGVVLGVGALLVTLALMTGFEEELRTKILGTNAHIVVVRGLASLQIEAPEELADRVRAVPGVAGAAPFVYSKVMIASGSQVDGIVLKGIDPRRAGEVIDLAGNMREGSLADLDRPGPAAGEAEAPAGTPEAGVYGAEIEPGREAAAAVGAGDPDAPVEPDGIILGRHLAAQLGVGRGDRVRLISSATIATPAGGVPRSRAFRVVGVFESGMFDYDAGMAYISIPAAQRLLGLGASATGVEVRVADIMNTRPIVDEIRRQLGPAFWVRDWMDMNRSFFAALKLEKVVMFLVLLLIVIVAAFNIVGTLTMMVIEKNRDIGILKAMGARSRDVLVIFIVQGMVIGIVGTLAGGALGLTISHIADRYQLVKLQGDVYFIDHVPFTIRALHVLLVCASSLAISFIATIFPAYQASKLDPVEAIRYG